MLIDAMIAPLVAGDVDPSATQNTAVGLVGLLHNMTSSPSGLQIVWFLLIAVLWTGYLVLEGFDFGVGMLLPFVGKKNDERRAALSTIGPLWDGNEVWLLTAGGATFAAFPEWYATLFPAAYLALFLILFGLIIRAVGFEYRSKVNSAGWRRLWDWCIIIGSWLPAVLWGVAFANLVAGARAAVDAAQIGPSKIVYAGNFWNLVLDHNGFLLLGGVTTAALFLAHGSHFLALKTDGVVRERAEKLSPKLTIVATVVAAVWVLWLGFKFAGNNHLTVVVWIAIVVAALALVASVLMSMQKKFGFAFTGTTVALLAAVVTIFGTLYPNVINGSSVKVKGDALADPIVGFFVLGNVDENGALVSEGGRAPTVVDVVHATIGLVAASNPTAADLPEASPEGQALTHAILADVFTGTYPAAGVITQADTKAAVDLTFGVYGAAAVPGGAIDPMTFGKNVTPSQDAIDLTNAVVAAVKDGTLSGPGTSVAGVVSYENVVEVIKITLERNGLPTDDATIGKVVGDIASGSATIGPLPAETVVTEVQKTVTACLGMLEQSVTAVIGTIPATLQAVADQVVAADNPNGAKDRTLFGNGMDLSKILIGDVKGWKKSDGLANLNPRIENANGALGALHAVGILPGVFQESCTADDGKKIDNCTETLKPFKSGAMVTGQTMMTSSSSKLTLKLMTWVAVILTPIVLLYQAWSIWTFRKRISAERIPAEAGLAPSTK